MTHMTRRDVLFGLAGFGAFLVKPHIVRAVSPISVFAPEHRPLIAAVVERILPGAKEAGVPDFIAYWLGQKPFESMRNFMVHGLRVLDKTASRQHNRSFVQCKDEQQDAVLRGFAENKVKGDRFNAHLFFQKLVELTLEGYLSDPKYGGNRNRAGWRFIGIPDGLRSCWWNPNGVEELLEND